MKDKKPTVKQQKFIDEYLIDLNATQAAKRAGYSPKTAKSQGQRLLTKEEIHAQIEKKLAKNAEKAGITAQKVIEGLIEVNARCLQKKPVMVWDKAERKMKQKTDPDTGEGIWNFDSTGANRSLELLGRYLGLFERDNSQKTQDVVVNVIDRYGDKKQSKTPEKQ